MTSNKRADRPGQWLTVAGGGILILAAALLVPGIDALNRATYGGGGNSAEALTLLGLGAVALLAGAAVLIVGRRRSAAGMRRPRTYADRHDHHTLPAEDRPTNPNDTLLRGYQEGI
ncbi:hypothetical protein E2F48_03175 [Arthrobacter crusticola]|uniref:Uncharacterized protein n=1 Tax=Arthrobacter crusticola TaxID=2547960 RepID=A0A4R5U3H1_9MICC|nr:hypothetical protein [Arthrobacter crusticola]TDK28112.1 hypothetical protein E2F48_03175 [Arthrobacter crusticola]